MSDARLEGVADPRRENDLKERQGKKKPWSRPHAIESEISDTANAIGGGGDGGGFPSSHS